MIDLNRRVSVRSKGLCEGLTHTLSDEMNIGPSRFTFLSVYAHGCKSHALSTLSAFGKFNIKVIEKEEDINPLATKCKGCVRVFLNVQRCYLS